MAKSEPGSNQVVQFLRSRDYKLLRELGQGACGKTVLLHDEIIDEYYVCKKYHPYSESARHELFTGFVKEIKLLHQVQHANVVRIFNHYLYPNLFTGYILMEYVNGSDIDKYVSEYPEKINEIFQQAILGFSYLESKGILHRDIRPGNIMVRQDGIAKIIDLGFGKHILTPADFDKSISLNWWCQPPLEFKDVRYDFATEVYFLGKLFERLIQENSLNHFNYLQILGKMCNRDPAIRTRSFSEIAKHVGNNQFFELHFTDEERETYRSFSDALRRQVVKIPNGAQYVHDISRLISQLEEIYRSVMLEDDVPDAAVVLRCFITGVYYYKPTGLPVTDLRDFLQLLKSSTPEKSRIILANLHTKLDAVPRYDIEPEGEIPF